MKDMVKHLVYTGIGAVCLTKEKIDELRRELEDKGRMSHEEGQLFVSELSQKSEQAKNQVHQWIARQIEEQIAKLNLATQADIEALQRKIDELQERLNKN